MIPTVVIRTGATFYGIQVSKEFWMTHTISGYFFRQTETKTET